MRTLVRLSLAASVLAVSGMAASAQITTPALLASTDPTAGNDIHIFDPVTAAFTGTTPAGLRITAMAYDQANRRVYFLARGTPQTVTLLYSLDLDPLGAPSLIGTVSGAASNVTSGGMSWDGANNQLIVTFLARLFTLDPTTAVITELRAFTGPTLNASDIDPVTGSLYVASSSATVGSGFTGRGIYRIDQPYASSTPVKIANYPIRDGTTQENSIYGLGVGNGTVFLTTEEPLNLYRLRLSDYAFEAPVLQPFTGAGVLGGGATFVPSATAGPDVAVAMKSESETVVPVPGQFTFTVVVANIGSQAADNVTSSVPLPVGTTYVTSTNGSTLSGSNVNFAAGSLLPGQRASYSVALASASAFTATASAQTTSADVYTGNNSASISSDIGLTDLAVNVVAPANCSIAPGGSGNFAFAVTNSGANAVNAILNVAIPAGATLVSSSPSGTVNAGVLTINAGLLVAGQVASIDVLITPGDGVNFSLTGTVPSDDDATNNSATGTTTNVNFSTASLRALLSTVSGASNSTFPGLVGALAGPPAVQGTLDCTRSANSQWMTSHWRASIDTQDDVLVRTNLVTGVSTVMAQEGATALPPDGFTPFFNTFLTPGVNNSGDFSVTGRFSDPNTATDQYAVKNIGGSYALVAREGSPVPSLPGLTYGSTLSGAGITNAGATAFIASSLGGAITAENQAFLANDGATLIARKGITTPAGAAGPITSMFGTGCFVSADGTRYIFSGNTTVGGSKTVAVVGTVGGTDATVLVQTGTVLPGFTSPVSNFQTQSTFMVPEGRWFVRGSNSDGEDWVISGTGNTVDASNVVLRTGTVASPLPIMPGSSEVWDAGASTVNNITGYTTNPRGDTLVYGKTLGDTRSDLVFLYNGTTILAREGDPVDADGDGVFNDDVYLRQLDFDDKLVMTDEAVYAFIALRDRPGVCNNSTASVGSALIRIPLPAATMSVCCRGATCAVIAPAMCTDPAGTAGVFQSSATACANASTTTPCCFADYNKVGGIEVNDIFDFLNDWFAGSTFADTHSDGSTAPDVNSIFEFLNAWFAGGC